MEDSVLSLETFCWPLKVMCSHVHTHAQTLLIPVC